MHYYFTPFILPLIVSAVTLTVLAPHARASTEGPAASALFWAILAIAFWNTFYALEIAAVGVEAKLRWANLQFIGIGSAPILWFSTVRRLLRIEEKRPALFRLIWIIPGITLFLALTDRYHGLFRHSYELVTVFGVLLLETEYGIWHNLVFVPFQYALYLGALLYLIRSALQARPYYRRRYVYMLLAALAPLLGSLLYVLGLEPFTLVNPTPVLLTVAVVIFAVLVFHHRLFDVRPVARARVVENLSDGVLVLDSRLRIVDFNPAATRIFPGLSEGSVGIPGATLFEDDEILGELLKAPPGETAHIEVGEGEARRLYRCTRTTVPGSRLRDIATVLIFDDETEERRLMERLEELASMDALTELPNRRTIFGRFREELERARRHGHPIALIIMDLDHFKRVNDNYGHAVGDEVLRVLGRLLKESARSADVIGRYGGEEFALCLPETTPEDAMQFAERLRRRIEALRVAAGDKEVRVTSSFGVCGRHRVGHEELRELLSHADAALYRAKHLGRNRSVFCDLMIRTSARE